LVLSKNLRKFSWFSLNNLEKNTSYIRVKNRCIISNRARFIFNKYKVSRIMFKHFVTICDINGVYKKDW
jgi:small subunit ribosomal protein S14